MNPSGVATSPEGRHRSIEMAQIQLQQASNVEVILMSKRSKHSEYDSLKELLLHQRDELNRRIEQRRKESRRARARR